MHAPIRNSLVTRAILVFSICFSGAAIFFLAGCGRSTSDSNASSSPSPGADATVAGAMLRAEPNPVPAGDKAGATTITWQTADDTIGDVYVADSGGERLFASGAKGSQEAPWIRPGSTTFRLCRHADHALLAQLTVTMPDARSASAPATPLVTGSP
jgi:hypothetical protein